MKPEEIENIISDIMINDGPDGHCDGSEVITSFIMSLLNGDGDEWIKEYFKDMKKEMVFTTH